MDSLEITLNALREAVRLAPDNVALATHFVQQLIAALRYDEAEQQTRTLLARFPQLAELKELMAFIYYCQNKNSHALAIIETLTSVGQPTATALVLHAKLHYRSGQVADAVARYKQAIEVDEAAWDENFANTLGIARWDEPDEEQEALEAFDGRMRNFVEAQADDEVLTPMEKPNINFADVGGMQKVKSDIEVKIIFPIKHAEMYAAYGKKSGGGILMYGPPGCGKTYLARATAGEVDATFLAIGIDDVLDMWVGNSERNLHGIFEQARQNRPCIVFFDEVDALGASRSDMRQSGVRHLVNQFLAELDGVDKNNEGLLILGATNAPWHIDPAFRRPGRFDQIVFVPPPDQPARIEILQILLKNKPTDDIQFKQIADKTNEFSGADLQAVVERAIESKLQNAIRSGKPTPLTTKDLLEAVKQTKPTTKEWFATAKNHALYANQGGTYDDILQYLKLK